MVVVSKSTAAAASASTGKSKGSLDNAAGKQKGLPNVRASKSCESCELVCKPCESHCEPCDSCEPGCEPCESPFLREK